MGNTLSFDKTKIAASDEALAALIETKIKEISLHKNKSKTHNAAIRALAYIKQEVEGGSISQKNVETTIGKLLYNFGETIKIIPQVEDCLYQVRAYYTEVAKGENSPIELQNRM